MTPPRLAGVIVFAAALAAAPAPAAAEGAQAWLARGDAAVASWDRVVAREAYERAVDASASAADLTAEGMARKKLAAVLLALGDRPAAVPQFDGLARLYQKTGDVQSAGASMLRAAQTLLDIDRYEEVQRRIADYARLGDPNPIRRAEVAMVRSFAYERGRRTDLARQSLLEAKRDLPPLVWHRFLREDAIRLGMDVDDAPRWLVPAVAAFAAIVAVAAFAWRRRRLELALLGVTCLVTVAVAEIALRIAMPPSDTTVRHLLRPPHQATTFRPEPGVMPGIDVAETRFTANAIGLRGREMPSPGTPRWIAVGGSSTESLFLDDADAWPTVVERELRTKHGRDVWIGNAGMSGLTSFSHVGMLEAWQDEIAPQLVVIQAGFNDMSLCVSGGRQDVLDNALRFRWAGYPGAYARFAFHDIRPPAAKSRWRIEELVDRVRARRSAGGGMLSDRTHVVQDRAGTHYQALRSHRQAAAKVDAVPVVDECVRSFADNLRRIADWAQARKVRLVLLTQGSLYSRQITPEEERLLWFGSVDQSLFDVPPPQRFFTVRVMGELLGRYNAAMLAVCAERKLWCHDVDTFVPQTAAMYYDDAHVNVRGSRRLGEELAKRLAEAIAANGGY